nr:hypothetical protein [Tanacetum cinerariifolium]
DGGGAGHGDRRLRPPVAGQPAGLPAALYRRREARAAGARRPARAARRHPAVARSVAGRTVRLIGLVRLFLPHRRVAGLLLDVQLR